jgi:hypothetical protein
MANCCRNRPWLPVVSAGQVNAMSRVVILGRGYAFQYTPPGHPFKGRFFVQLSHNCMFCKKLARHRSPTITVDAHPLYLEEICHVSPSFIVYT